MAKNGPKMDFQGNFPFFSISGPFFGLFALVRLRVVFRLGFHFFPISGFQAVFHSVQARLNPKTRLVSNRLNIFKPLVFRDAALGP